MKEKYSKQEIEEMANILANSIRKAIQMMDELFIETMKALEERERIEYENKKYIQNTEERKNF